VSGLVFRNLAIPMLPPAPLEFSITIDLFVFDSANCTNFLAIVSTDPPGAVGTIIRG
jgi:hypothetical protein